MKRAPFVLLSTALALAAAIADVASKFFFFTFGPHPIFFISSDLARLTDHRNFGLPFDLPFPHTWLLAVNGFFLLLVFLFFLLRKPLPARAVSFGLILGGALGNLYDRITLGFVRDWFLFFGHSAVNLADIFILTGIYVTLFSGRTKNPG